jgi:DNA polymerase-3 subunit alpha
MIAYETAYLKANYPVEYMTAVLTAESRANTGPARDEKIASIVAECRRTGLTLLPPDINASDVEFSIENGKIRFGLSAIKNVGSAAIDSILEARRQKPFTGMSDVMTRVDTSKVNRKTFESLIRTGALDAFGTRAAMLSSIVSMLERSHKDKRAVLAGQVGLFSEQHESSAESLPDLPELTQSELLGFEKELLGFYLTTHPLEPHRKLFENQSFTPIAEITHERVGVRLQLAGIVVSVKKIYTKANNHEMAFVKLEDLGGTIEVVVFPKIYARTVDLWHADSLVKLSGKVDEKEDRLTILADDASQL